MVIVDVLVKSGGSECDWVGSGGWYYLVDFVLVVGCYVLFEVGWDLMGR